MMNKVFARIDSNNVIQEVLSDYQYFDHTDWIQFDEGEGTRYRLSHLVYFFDGLKDDRGICRYKLVDGAPELRSASEMKIERDPILWSEIREKRNSLLLDSDWTQLADSPLTEEKKAEWKAYRAALRDLPDSFSDPESVTFPDPPG